MEYPSDFAEENRLETTLNSPSVSTNFWFTMDEITARINELKRQRARGAVISPAHLSRLEEIAAEIRSMTEQYDPAR